MAEVDAPSGVRECADVGSGFWFAVGANYDPDPDFQMTVMSLAANATTGRLGHRPAR
jgi:hypothetical protein